MLPKYKTMEIFHMDLILSEWKMPSWIKDKITTTFCQKSYQIELRFLYSETVAIPLVESVPRVVFGLKSLLWNDL